MTKVSELRQVISFLYKFSYLLLVSCRIGSRSKVFLCLFSSHLMIISYMNEFISKSFILQMRKPLLVHFTLPASGFLVTCFLAQSQQPDAGCTNINNLSWQQSQLLCLMTLHSVYWIELSSHMSSWKGLQSSYALSLCQSTWEGELLGPAFN